MIPIFNYFSSTLCQVLWLAYSTQTEALTSVPPKVSDTGCKMAQLLGEPSLGIAFFWVLIFVNIQPDHQSTDINHCHVGQTVVRPTSLPAQEPVMSLAYAPGLFL